MNSAIIMCSLSHLQFAIICNILPISIASCPLSAFEEERRLTNHMFMKLTDIGPNMCDDICMRTKDCESFNYNLFRFECELNKGTVGSLPDPDFVTLQRFLYGEKDLQKLKEPCASSSCADHEECVVTSPLTHSCTLTTCDAPQNILNSKPWVSPPLQNVGASVTHICNTGYAMSGTAHSICRTSGKWSETGSCEYDCGSPSTVSGADVSYSKTIKNSVATYNCKSGYALIGNDLDIVCNEGGWSAPQFTCTFDCGTPPNLQQGSVDFSSTLVNSVATYECNSNFAIQGKTTRTCKDTGWTNNAIQCIFDCGSPPSLQNGQATYSSSLLYSNATYSCDINYVLDGSPNLTCTENGWSTPQMQCVFDCGPPPNLQNGNAVYSSTILGSNATYSCNNNYVMSGSSAITCSSTGWSTSLPTCLSDCGEPSSTVANANLGSGSTIQGSKRTYTCKSQYTASSSNTKITCQSSGQWSSPTFQCLDKCPSGWRKDTSYSTCYKYFQQWVKWSGAVSACSALGATVMSLQTTAKRDAVFVYLEGRVHHNEFYIGGYTNNYQSGIWYWESDGSSFTEDSPIWKDDEPKDNKPCSFIHHEKEIKSTQCNEWLYYICEIPL